MPQHPSIYLEFFQTNVAKVFISIRIVSERLNAFGSSLPIKKFNKFHHFSYPSYYYISIKFA